MLSGAYELRRDQRAEAIEGLLRTKAIVVERADTVWQALRLFQAGDADFADCVIERSGAAAGCVRTVSFDRAAAKTSGMTLLA